MLVAPGLVTATQFENRSTSHGAQLQELVLGGRSFCRTTDRLTEVLPQFRRVPATNYEERSMAMYDFDNDGDDDVITSRAIYVNPTINHDPRVIRLSYEGRYSRRSPIAVGDLTGDGRKDIVGEDYYQSNENWAPQIRSMQARSVVLGDMNGDGRLDIVAADYKDDVLSVKLFLNFRDELDYEKAIFVASIVADDCGYVPFEFNRNRVTYHHTVAVLDVDGDHRLDVLCVKDKIFWYKNYGNAGFNRNERLVLFDTSGAFWLKAADIEQGYPYSTRRPKLFFAYEDPVLARQYVHWATYDADEHIYKDRGRFVTTEFGSAFTVAPIDDGPTMDLAFAGQLVDPSAGYGIWVFTWSDTAPHYHTSRSRRILSDTYADVRSSSKFIFGLKFTDYDGDGDKDVVLLTPLSISWIRNEIGQCSALATPAPTPRRTWEPSAVPSPAPTPLPTATPTLSPTPSPSPSPTLSPTAEPTPTPTKAPTPVPTSSPTAAPTEHPSPSPTSSPTATPTLTPTAPPSPAPTHSPTYSPTSLPSPSPTSSPSASPTNAPTPNPTSDPDLSLSARPTPAPTTDGDLADSDSGLGLEIILVIVFVVLAVFAMVVVAGACYHSAHKNKGKTVRPTPVNIHVLGQGVMHAGDAKAAAAAHGKDAGGNSGSKNVGKLISGNGGRAGGENFPGPGSGNSEEKAQPDGVQVLGNGVRVFNHAAAAAGEREHQHQPLENKSAGDFPAPSAPALEAETGDLPPRAPPEYDSHVEETTLRRVTESRRRFGCRRPLPPSRPLRRDDTLTTTLGSGGDVTTSSTFQFVRRMPLSSTLSTTQSSGFSMDATYRAHRQH